MKNEEVRVSVKKIILMPLDENGLSEGQLVLTLKKAREVNASEVKQTALSIIGEEKLKPNQVLQVPTGAGTFFFMGEKAGR